MYDVYKDELEESQSFTYLRPIFDQELNKQDFYNSDDKADKIADSNEEYTFENFQENPNDIHNIFDIQGEFSYVFAKEYFVSNHCEIQLVYEHKKSFSEDASDSYILVYDSYESKKEEEDLLVHENFIREELNQMNQERYNENYEDMLIHVCKDKEIMQQQYSQLDQLELFSEETKVNLHGFHDLVAIDLEVFISSNPPPLFHYEYRFQYHLNL